MRFSIIVPAYNEEKGLEAAVKGLVFFLDKNNFLKDTEILIFNDCSSDRTKEIADNLAKEFKNISAFHNQKNMGLGFNFQEGVRRAKGEFVTWFPGDNENLPEPFVNTFQYIGKNDVVIAYTSNMEVRPIFRRIVSRIYTIVNNFIFGLDVKYYNGLNICRRKLLLQLPPVSNSFSFAVEILVFLLKSGATHVEVPVMLKPNPSGKSSAFRLKNVKNVIKAVIQLFWKINIKRERIKI